MPMLEQDRYSAGRRLFMIRGRHGWNDLVESITEGELAKRQAPAICDAAGWNRRFGIRTAVLRRYEIEMVNKP